MSSRTRNSPLNSTRNTSRGSSSGGGRAGGGSSVTLPGINRRSNSPAASTSATSVASTTAHVTTARTPQVSVQDPASASTSNQQTGEAAFFATSTTTGASTTTPAATAVGQSSPTTASGLIMPGSRSHRSPIPGFSSKTSSTTNPQRTSSPGTTSARAGASASHRTGATSSRNISSRERAGHNTRDAHHHTTTATASRSQRGGATSSSARSYNTPNYNRSGFGGSRSRGGYANDEKMMKRTQKKLRDLMRLEFKDRQQYDAERDAFVEVVIKSFDEERENMMTKTIERLNREVSTLKRDLNQNELNWRAKWKRVLTEVGKFTEMNVTERTLSESCIISQLQEGGEDGNNFNEIATKLTSYTKEASEKLQQLKQENLNEKIRGDELDTKLDDRTKELVAADRLIRTHLVGRGSEATIAVELFRKQGIDFEQRFEALEREFKNRVNEMLKDSASIEMVGAHNHEDAVIAKLKLNRQLDSNTNINASTSAVSDSSSGGGEEGTNTNNNTVIRQTLSEQNARTVTDSKAWRPSGTNYVDILETFITSHECQKILQVQLLRDVQLAMIELSKKHFQNVTSEIRKNRSNLPASVRGKLFDEHRTTRDDLVELLDLLSFEPTVGEIIMGRFPPTELDDAAPELKRFLDSHDYVNNKQQETTTTTTTASSPKHQQQQQQPSNTATSISNVSIDGGDARSAGVDFSSISKKNKKSYIPSNLMMPNNSSMAPGTQIRFPTAFAEFSSAVSGGGSPNNNTNLVNPKRVNLPRKPFDVYSSRIQKARLGFLENTSSSSGSASVGGDGESLMTTTSSREGSQ